MSDIARQTIDRITELVQGSAGSSSGSNVGRGLRIAGALTLSAFVAYKTQRWVRRSFGSAPWSAHEKVIVITGASSGIGAAMAKEFARDGARLILVARREDELRDVAKECQKLGAFAAVVRVCDVASERSVKDMIEFVRGRFGRIDCLCLVAGISMGACFFDLDELKFLRKVMDVNYFGSIGPVLYARDLLDRSEDPHIVVVSSIAGKVGLPTRTGYSASKFALHGFFDALRREYLMEGRDVPITMVMPGPIATNINRTRLGPKKFELDLSKSMPVKECAKIIVDGVAHGDREVWVPKSFEFKVNLGGHLPASFTDRMLVREMRNLSKEL